MRLAVLVPSLLCWGLSQPAYSATGEEGATKAGTESRTALEQQILAFSYAEQPVKGFNRLLADSAKRNENWVTNSRLVTRHYLGIEDTSAKLRASDIASGTASYSVLQPIERGGVDSALYQVYLEKQEGGWWKVSSARVSWRCTASQTFSTHRCE